MFLVNSTVRNIEHKELLLMLGCFLRGLPRAQLCHSARIASSSQEEPMHKTLPSLPVQPLEQMLEKYIKSIKPFVNSSEFETTKKLIKSFCEDKNSGKKLQRLLEERAKSMDNWLADWWLQTAYLEYRDPVTIYSSPALVWPKKKFQNQNDQLIYAAHVINAALNFNKKVEMREIPQDKLGKNSLCMSQYEKIFGTCRIPKIPRDELLFQDPQNPSTNIIIMYNNFLFNVPAFQNSEREPFSASHFYAVLLDVVASGDKKTGVPVGILTTEQRDNWANSYEELKKNASNKRILEEYVEKALFVVCIDKPIGSICERLSYGNKCSKLLLHGFGFRGNAGNRWFDKTIQFVIGADEDGVGIVYEHSPAEGGPVAVLTDFIHSNMHIAEGLHGLPNHPKSEKLEFVISDVIKENIISAGEALNRMSDDLDVYGWSFTEFGKNEIKSLNVSPDSFIQIAIQCAFYKMHSRPAAQYESGSLRKFIFGRTDTIRSCSEEVVNFCETILNPKASSVEISRALHHAIDSHKNYARDVIEGRGVDRHLLGLKILAKLNEIEDPEIFADLAYKRSTYFQLSTSNVPTKCDAFMVYGPLVYDGYACCYNPREQSINFGISAWSSCKTTRLNLFQKNLEEALVLMRRYLETARMTVDMCDQKIWDVRASDLASNTYNPIRAIVESLQIEPNPSKPMISLSIGDPTIFGNLKPPRESIEALMKSVDCGKCNGYAPSIGMVKARQAVANYSSSDKLTVDWKNVILCSGCSTALDLCISVLANPGENILIPRPGFSLYRTLAEGLGIKVKPYNLRPDSRWEVDLEHLESQLDCNTKAIVINNPSNPCGSVFSKRHLKEILDVASRNCVPIIADEIYEHLVFAGEEFFPLASLSSDVPILSCSGLTKRFLVPGWRVGWIIIHDRNGIFNKEIKPGLVKLSQRQLGCNTIVQEAISDILKFTPPDFYNNTIKTLQKNAMIAYKRLSEIPGLTPVMPQGAMYIMIGIDMNMFPGIKNDLEFVELMVTEESVFCLPGKCFDYPNYVRIIISPPEEMLKEACERIAYFCERHYKTPPKKSSDNLTSYREVSLAESPASENSGRNLG